MAKPDLLVMSLDNFPLGTLKRSTEGKSCLLKRLHWSQLAQNRDNWMGKLQLSPDAHSPNLEWHKHLTTDSIRQPTLLQPRLATRPALLAVRQQLRRISRQSCTTLPSSWRRSVASCSSMACRLETGPGSPA